MPNIAYFEIPADNVERAKHFYHTLLGWKIEPTRIPLNPEMMKMMEEFQDVRTGEPKEGTMNMGGMYKRQMPQQALLNFVLVDNIDKVLAEVEKLGGKVTMPKVEIQSVGEMAAILDTEGNSIGLWKLNEEFVIGYP